MTFLLAVSRTLALLLAMHAACDYALQDEKMERYKNPRKNRDDPTYGPWWWTMAAHSAINAGGVMVVTGSMIISLAEFMAHFTLDNMKCRGMISTHEDQSMHIFSKLVWALWASALC